MKKIEINLAIKISNAFPAIAIAAAGALIALLLTWYNVETYSRNSSLVKAMDERVGGLEKALPESAIKEISTGEDEIKELKHDIEFINRYIDKRSFSWTGLLTGLEEALPEGVYLVQISPEFNDSRLKVTGAARSIDSVLATVDRMGSGSFSEVFLIKHSRDEKGNLILFEIAAKFRAGSDA